MSVFCIEGVKVTCPKCGAHIATVLRDLYCSTVARKEDFQFEDTHYPHSGLTSCNICGALYIQSGKLHTEFGWVGGSLKINKTLPFNELITEITEVS